VERAGPGLSPGGRRRDVGLKRAGRVTREFAERVALEADAVVQTVAQYVGTLTWRDAEGRLVAMWAPGTGEFRVVEVAA
jgi:hypothetical protein